MHMHHEEEHFTSSDLVKDIVIGMADGLTVPFALAAGLSGAVDSNTIIITAGVAEIIAGSIAMGLGGYLAGKTEVDHYHSELKREYDEVDRVPEREKQEIRDILEEYGISKPTQELVTDELSQNKDKWVDFMMRFELGLEEPHEKRARNSAANIALSYIAGGMIPLSAYLFTDHPHEGIVYSSIITLLALLIFGFFKSKVTGQNPISGALRTAAVGALAAGAAYFIASWIGG
ncbi:VIT1/CCC1 transporter family protein [soil metagenome]